jgi:hypothetical protein
MDGIRAAREERMRLIGRSVEATSTMVASSGKFKAVEATENRKITEVTDGIS